MSIDKMIEETIKTATEKQMRELRSILVDSFSEIATTVKANQYAANDLLNEKQVAELIGVSVLTLQQWRSGKKYLPYCKIGNAPRYKYADILTYVARNTIRVTGC